jgi:L-iditol 2-dehydrogenase
VRHAAAPVAEKAPPPPARMQAVVFTRPGEFEITEVATPEPGPGEVLLRVRACMICATDRKILDGKFAGTRFPVIPGHEMSGEVVTSHGGVAWDARAAEGDPPSRRVGVEVHVGCGTCARCREGLYNLCLNYGRRETGHAHIGFTVPGGLAEYVAVPASALHALSAHVSYEEGAWTDNLGVALWALERGRIEAGDRVVVIGPGAIGLCAAQLARALGAGRVTVIGHAGARLERARPFADEIVDHVEAQVLSGTADLVVEFAGTAQAARDALRLARRGGRVVLGGATGQGVELSGVDLSTIVRGHLDVMGSVANPKGVSGRALSVLARGGVDVRSLITHRFPLSRFADAWTTFTERRDGAIRVMLMPGEMSG